MWADNPLFGTGTGGWLANYMHFQADFFALHPLSSWGMLADNAVCPYNEFLHIAAEQGLLGLVLVGWMLCEWLRYPSVTWEDTCLKGMLAAFAREVCFGGSRSFCCPVSFVVVVPDI